MILRERSTELTVGELRKELEGLPDDLPVFIEHVSDRTFYTQNFYAACLTCDSTQTCAVFASGDTKGCVNCYQAYNYTSAFRVVKTKEGVFIDCSY